MSADPQRAALDAAVLEWMREPQWRDDEARFETLARQAFAFQYEHGAAYRRYCDSLGRSPANVDRWQDVPAVPTGAFKEVRLACFEAANDVKVFRTSGTAAAKRGALHLDTLALYEASLLPTLRRLLLPGVERMLSLIHI